MLEIYKYFNYSHCALTVITFCSFNHMTHENTADVKQMRPWLQILDVYIIALNLSIDICTVSRSRVFTL